MRWVRAERLMRPAIGVRMALGPPPPRVPLVIRQRGRPAAVGVMLGLAGAFILTRFLKRMLFGVATVDTVTFSSAQRFLRRGSCGQLHPGFASGARRSG